MLYVKNMKNYHDYLIEFLQIGPRRELILSLRDIKNNPCGKIRFSAINEYNHVQEWYKKNEEIIKTINEGNRLAAIDSINETPSGNSKYSYVLKCDKFDPLNFNSKEIQEIT
jgi:hypothetical protein